MTYKGKSAAQWRKSSNRWMAACMGMMILTIPVGALVYDTSAPWLVWGVVVLEVICGLRAIGTQDYMVRAEAAAMVAGPSTMDDELIKIDL